VAFYNELKKRRELKILVKIRYEYT